MAARKRKTILTISDKDKRAKINLVQVLLYFCLVLFSLIVPVPSFLTREMLVVLAIWVGVIVLWITEALHLAISGFIGCCLLYSIGNLFRWPELRAGAFSGFSEPTVWFVFSGLILGLAMHRTELAKTFAMYCFNKLNGNFPRVLLAYMLVLMGVSYLVPSGDAVTVIMCTLSIGLLELPEFKDKPNVAKIIFLVPAIAAGVFNKAILHGTSAIMAAGIIERFSGDVINFSEWFVYMLPAQFILLVWIYFWFQILFKPEKIIWEKKNKEASEKLSLTAEQKKAAIWLVLGMVLWFTDKITNLRPDMICMGLAIGLMLPKVGVIRARELKTELNWMVLIFLGTAFSIVNTLEATGIFKVVSDSILSKIPEDMSISGLVLLIALMALVLHFLTGHTSVLVSSILPVILAWGKTQGISVVILTFAFLWGASAEMLVYQSGAFMIAYAYGYFSVKDLFKAGLITTAGVMLTVVVLDLFWWPLFLQGR